MAFRVLLVEDDAEIAEFVAQGLREEGFLVETASDGHGGAHALAVSTWDLVILDWWLPGPDGCALLRDFRAAGKTTPVLFLTARDAVAQRVEGLNAGADDYLCKPFAFEELLARARALHGAGGRVGDNLDDGGALGTLALPTGVAAHQPDGRVRPLDSPGSGLHAATRRAGHARRARGPRAGLQRVADRLARIAGAAAAVHRGRVAPAPHPFDRHAGVGGGRLAPRPRPGRASSGARGGAAAGGQQRQIIESLLFLARSDGAALLGAPEAVDLNDWGQSWLGAWAEHPRGGDLTFQPAPGPAVTTTHPALLGQVLDNLLDNACKYSEPGTPIGVVVDAAPDRVGVTASDAGCGVAADQRDLIFEPFFRTTKACWNGKAGVGLGLAVVRRLAGILGARVAVASESGKGSSFKVALPADKEHARPSETVKEK